jgi:predicted phage terminase large subunit-like protein
VVDVRSLHSPAERERVADYFTNNLMNLLEPDGRFWGIFTPWHRDDLNARLKRNAAYALFSQAVGADFEPVWPERWPAERLRARKNEIGMASFSRGYRLQPVSEEDTLIRTGWVKFWTEPAEYEQIVLSVDPAVSTAEKADRSALVVLGKIASRKSEIQNTKLEMKTAERPSASVHPDVIQTSPVSDFEFRVSSLPESQIRVLAARAARLSAPELVALIDEFDRVYRPAVILFESNAAFRGLKDLLARQERFGPKLKGVTQTTDKWARIAAFSVAVENGAFRLRGNETGEGVEESQRELFEEMVSFPYHDHDDLVDAAATGCAYLLQYREPRIF